MDKARGRRGFRPLAPGAYASGPSRLITFAVAVAIHLAPTRAARYTLTVPPRPSPAVRRAIIAVPFFAAILLAMRLDRGPSRSAADAAHPGFVLRDETAAA